MKKHKPQTVRKSEARYRSGRPSIETQLNMPMVLTWARRMKRDTIDSVDADLICIAWVRNHKPGRDHREEQKYCEHKQAHKFCTSCCSLTTGHVIVCEVVIILSQETLTLHTGINRDESKMKNPTPPENSAVSVWRRRRMF
jgi:hypothetical protein